MIIDKKPDTKARAILHILYFFMELTVDYALKIIVGLILILLFAHTIPILFLEALKQFLWP